MAADKANQHAMQDSGDHSTAVQDAAGHDSDDQNMVDLDMGQHSPGPNPIPGAVKEFVVLPPLQTDEVGSTNNGPNTNYILFWNHAGLEHNRLSHAEVNGFIGGPQNGPPISARALGMLHIAIHDAYFAIHPPVATDFGQEWAGFKPYLGSRLPARGTANNAELAVAGAAISIFQRLYAQTTPPNRKVATKLIDRLEQLLVDLKTEYKTIFTTDLGFSATTSNESFQFGTEVGEEVFKLLKHDDGAAEGNYKLKQGRYHFEDEPTHPVRTLPQDPDVPLTVAGSVPEVKRLHHAAAYGFRAKRFAIQKDHVIADPPGILSAQGLTRDYDSALDDVIRMGGATALNTTRRSAAQTAKGHFWAYDGANLLGTPPRHYNQILRRIAVNYSKERSQLNSEVNNADFARLFALVNTAMADAGVLAWREKYFFDFWRPLSGVRRDGREEHGDPFWLTLGAPATNSHELPFKPPFPAYPSGHATFGAACLQMVRRYYKATRVQRPGTGLGHWENHQPDNISFQMVSDELNGINRDLRQPYNPDMPITDQLGTVRTRVDRTFSSCWEALWENALSRVWLGVHWSFDACAAQDILIATSTDRDHQYVVDQHGRTVYQPVKDVRYTGRGTRADRLSEGRNFPVGGIGLGIEIADDIFDTKMAQSRVPIQGQPPFGSSPALMGAPIL